MRFHLLVFLAILLQVVNSAADKQRKFKRNGFSATIKMDEKVKASDSTLKGIANSFFRIYPKLVKKYNEDAPKDVEIILLDTSWSFGEMIGTSRDNKLFINFYHTLPKGDELDKRIESGAKEVAMYPTHGPEWLKRSTTHYGGYMNTRSINVDLKPDTKQYEEYGVGAAFLNFLEKKHPKIREDLKSKMRSNSYGADSWTELTGSSLEKLWNEFVEEMNKDGGSAGKSIARG